MKRENLHDHYFLLAKKENFSARSVYKLKDIHEKYKILKSGDSVLDLGAAPGSWSEYIAEALSPKGRGKAGRLVSLDLQALSPKALERIRRSSIEFHFFQQSIEMPLPQDFPPFDVIVSDMAPSTQGSRFIDSFHSLELIQMAWALAEQKLKTGGHFVVKLFQSQETMDEVKKWHSHFRQSKLYRPPAVRKESKEIYFVGLDKQ